MRGRVVQTATRTLLRRWQRVAAARPAQTRDEREWHANELRWAFDHLLPTSTTATTRADRARVRDACVRLVQHREPLAYVLGSVPFGDLPHALAIAPPILVPRPETEQWTLRLAQRLQSAPPAHINILDIGTGSGCIAIQLAHALHTAPQRPWTVTGIDASPAAVALASANAARMHLPPQAIRFVQADLFDDAAMDAVLHTAFASPSINIVVSNPPYITPAHYHTSLDPSVRNWEDPAALIGARSPSSQIDDDDDAAGLAFYRRITTLLTRHASLFTATSTTPPLPILVLEIGHDQAHAVAAMLSPLARALRLPTAAITIDQDAWHTDRVVALHRR